MEFNPYRSRKLHSKLDNSAAIVLFLAAFLVFGYGAEYAFAQTSPRVVYVPLIGITSVPIPLTLPLGSGDVTYNYAVKNFIAETPLDNIRVTDDKCGPVAFVTGDDNRDSRLDYNETWRFTCTAKLTGTTRSVATATGTSNGLTAIHSAYTTVVAGSNVIPPLVSIVNVTKVTSPLVLSAGGGNITYTYKVNNPGDVALGQVTVSDNKCGTMTGKLGDTNGNELLDINEVWIYTCAATLTQDSTNTATVAGLANGMMASDNTTLAVNVAAPSNLFDLAVTPAAAASTDLTIPVWIILSVILAVFLILFVVIRSRRTRPSKVVVGKP
jgi:hypothetical protein